MISYIEGTIKVKGPNYIVVLTGGVGYKIHVPGHILNSVMAGSTAALYTHTYVKEDALDLYGFSTPEELALYELFLGVSGIGPKTALAIFGSGKMAAIKEAVIKGDAEFFTAVPRLGKKNAQKIIIELRSKLGSLGDLDLTGDGISESKEILEALQSFGFMASEAKEAVRFVHELEGDTSKKIKEALKFLGKGK